LYWDLAFGPDVGPIAAFTDGAAGTAAPLRPPNPTFPEDPPGDPVPADVGLRHLPLDASVTPSNSDRP
jgi:hypothetical protein